VPPLSRYDLLKFWKIDENRWKSMKNDFAPRNHFSSSPISKSETSHKALLWRFGLATMSLPCALTTARYDKSQGSNYMAKVSDGGLFSFFKKAWFRPSEPLFINAYLQTKKQSESSSMVVWFSYSHSSLRPKNSLLRHKSRVQLHDQSQRRRAIFQNMISPLCTTFRQVLSLNQKRATKLSYGGLV